MLLGIGANKHFVLDKIFCIERGTWSNRSQDWQAVIVSTEGARVETEIFYQEAVKFIRNALKEMRRKRKGVRNEN